MMLEAARPVCPPQLLHKYCESNFKVGPILKPDRPIVHCPNDANRFLHTIDIMRSSKVTNLPFANFFCCCLNKNTTHKCAKTLDILSVKDM